jgi:tetratricopeptide (TPR) repeat protein
VSGLKWYLPGEYARAGDDFQQAIEIDSTFARARVWLLAARGFTDPESVDSLAAEIERRESSLSAYDRHHARFFTAFLKEDLEQAYVEAKAMLEASPGSRDALRESALSAIRIGRSDEGIGLLLRLSHDHVLLRDWPQYWLYLSLAQLQLGNAESALRVARDGRKRHPDSPDPVTAEALALIDLDQVGEAVQILDAFFLTPRENPWIAASLLAVALRASGRGHKSVADSLLERSLAWMDLGDDPWSEDVYLRTLLAADNLPEAERVVEMEFAAGNRNAVTLGTYGIIAARIGDVEEANIALRDLGGRRDTRNRIWRARILAVQGREAEASQLLGRIEVDPWGVEMPVVLWPELAPLRGRPGFPDLPGPRDSPRR